jgi:hypothetical protein
MRIKQSEFRTRQGITHLIKCCLPLHNFPRTFETSPFNDITSNKKGRQASLSYLFVVDRAFNGCGGVGYFN